MNPAEHPHLRRSILVGVVVTCVVYLLGVLWCGYTVSDKHLEDVLPHSTAGNSKCDYLAKYLLSKGPKGDANAWLWEDYLDINFDSTILNDQICLGALLSEMSGNILAKKYHSKIEMRFLNRQDENVLIRLHYKF